MPMSCSWYYLAATLYHTVTGENSTIKTALPPAASCHPMSDWQNQSVLLLQSWQLHAAHQLHLLLLCCCLLLIW
jgi:hypothetical protein